MASATTEEAVREEQKEWEAQQAEGQPADDEPLTDEEAQEAKGELFDKSDYDREDIALPKVDGETTDKIAVKFSGTVLLERTDPNDVALMRKMRLGGDITLMVEAKCAGKGHGYTTSRDGELDAVVLTHAVRVHTVYNPAGEGTEDDGE